MWHDPLAPKFGAAISGHMKFWIFALPALFSVAAQAMPTDLVLYPSAPDNIWHARYSQALMLEAKLSDENGDAVINRRVSFFVSRNGDETSEFLLEDPLTDVQGVARARLTLVDGRYGGQSFAAAVTTPDSDGEEYTVRVSFLGDADAENCDGTGADAGMPPGADGGEADETLCASQAQKALYVSLENTRLSLQPGNEVKLGESVDLVALLEDPNGDAPLSGTDVDGDDALGIEGRNVTFYYDADGNGRPSAAERLGSAETDDSGRALFSFLADPTFVRAQNIDSGLHVQFGGDDRYALSGAEQALYVFPGEPDASRTVVTATPDAAMADGFSNIEIRATLVDSYNNLLDAEQDFYDVRFETTLGVLEGSVERDPLSGQYWQILQAPRVGGEATIQVFVADEAGPEASVQFTGSGCGCASQSDTAMLSWLVVFSLFFPVSFRKRMSS